MAGMAERAAVDRECGACDGSGTWCIDGIADPCPVCRGTGQLRVLEAELEVWTRVGSFREQALWVWPGAGTTRVLTRLGAYEEPVPCAVAIDGPGNVPHGVPLVGLTARDAVRGAGYAVA